MEGIGYLLLLSSVLLSSSLASPLEKRSVFGPKCYDMTSGFCGSIGYSKTSICTADHAVLESVLQSFQPLVASGCAEELKPFLCFAHLPICLKSEEPAEPNTIVKPCRSMCERVESKCGLLLKAVGLSWPESLNCTQYSDDKCASFPTSSPTPPPKCERCTVKRKSSLGLSKMCKKGSESDNVICKFIEHHTKTEHLHTTRMCGGRLKCAWNYMHSYLVKRGIVKNLCMACH